MHQSSSLQLDISIFRLSNVFGFTPYISSGDRLRFSWRSWQTIYFLFVMALIHCFSAFYIYVFLAESIRVGLTAGFQLLAWVFAHLVLNVTHWALLLKRKSIMGYYCACLAQRKTHHGASVERKLFNSKVVLLVIWAIFGGIIPVATVTLHNIARPQFSIYISSLFYSDDPPMGHLLQNVGLVFMVFLQCFTLVHGFFGSLMSDVIPMFIASSQFAVFKSVNQGLIRLKECKDSCQALSVKGKSSTLSPMTLAIIGEDSLDPSEERDCVVERSVALRNAMDVHLRAQNCVQIFNDAFGPLLVIFIVQVFIMICVLFFTIVKTPLTTVVDVVVFFGNGTQYFIRALIGLYIFGRVQGTYVNLFKTD